MRRQLGHPLPGAHGAGEADHVDVGMGGDGLAHHGAVPGDDVEHAGGEVDLHAPLGQDEGVEGRHLRRLQHDRAACGDGGRHLGHDLVQGVVPRRDGTDHTDGLLHDQ